MLKQLTILICLVSINAFKLMDFRYTNNDVVFDMYLNGVPSKISGYDMIDMFKDAAHEWNHIPYNQVQIHLGTVYDRYVKCPPQLDSELRWKMCFDNLGKFEPGYTTFRGMSFQPTQPTIVTSLRITLNPYHFFTSSSIYNTILHEMGHVNLLGHPTYGDSVMSNGFVYIENQDKFVKQTSRIVLTRDDINGVVYQYTKKIFNSQWELVPYLPLTFFQFAPNGTTKLIYTTKNVSTTRQYISQMGSNSSMVELMVGDSPVVESYSPTPAVPHSNGPTPQPSQLFPIHPTQSPSIYYDEYSYSYDDDLSTIINMLNDIQMKLKQIGL